MRVGRKRWYSDVPSVFVPNLIAMRTLSLWPLQKDNFISKIHWFMVIMCHFLLVALLSVELLSNCGKDADNFENVLVLINGIMCIAKILYMRIHHDKLVMNIKAAYNDWFSLKKNSELYEIMKKYGHFGQFISIVQLSIGVIGTILFGMATILFRKGRPQSFSNLTISHLSFIFPVECSIGRIIDTRDYFIMLLALQTLLLQVLGITVVTVDTFFFNITMHLCGQFVFLRQQFSQFAISEFTDADRRKRLKALIDTHDHLIKLAKNLQDTLNVILLLQIIQSGVAIALTGFRFVEAVVVRDVSWILKGVIGANFLGIEAFVYSYAGDFLYHKTADVTMGIYECKWFELSPPIVRDLKFIMMRIINMPIQFTGANVLYVTRSTMVDIFRTSVSYISLLRASTRK